MSLSINVPREMDLHVCCKYGANELVKRILASDVCPSIDSRVDYVTPLLVASLNGHADVVRTLLANNANVEAIRGAGVVSMYMAQRYGHALVDEPKAQNMHVTCTPLLVSSFGGHVDVVRLLLEAKANTQVQEGASGVTPLHAACEKGHTLVAEVLVNAGADVTTRTTMYAQTPLFLASRKGNVSIVALLLQKTVENINVPNDKSLTPLHIASHHGHADVVKTLLQANADMTTLSKTGNPPLYYASKSNNVDVVRLLLQNKADANHTGHKNVTPLHFASQHGNVEMIELLLQANADVDALYDGWVTPLLLAANHNKIDAAERLLQFGANVNPQRDVILKRDTPLHNAIRFAAKDGNTRLVKLLLANKADVNAAIGSKNETPLHTAFDGEYGLEVLKLLLAHDGIDVNPKPMTNGMTPLFLASKQGNEEAAKLLLDAGATVAPLCNGNEYDNDEKCLLTLTSECIHEKVFTNVNNPYVCYTPSDAQRLANKQDPFNREVAFDPIDVSILAKTLLRYHKVRVRHAASDESRKRVKVTKT